MNSNNWRNSDQGGRRNSNSGGEGSGDWQQKKKNNSNNRKNRNRNNNREEQKNRGRKNEGGVYRPPGQRNRQPSKKEQVKKIAPPKGNDFPSLSSSTNSLNGNSDSGPSWSSILGKKEEEGRQQQKKTTEVFSQTKVKDWADRPKNNNPIGKVIDLGEHQRRIRKYRENRPRQRFLPEVMKTDQELEMEQLREEDYWNNRYSGEVDDQEDSTSE